MPEKKIDGPDGVAFAKELAMNLPGNREHNRIVYGLGAAYLLTKAAKHVLKGK